jgi:hypothetical protein
MEEKKERKEEEEKRARQNCYALKGANLSGALLRLKEANDSCTLLSIVARVRLHVYKLGR